MRKMGGRPRGPPLTVRMSRGRTRWLRGRQAGEQAGRARLASAQGLTLGSRPQPDFVEAAAHRVRRPAQVGTDGIPIQLTPTQHLMPVGANLCQPLQLSYALGGPRTLGWRGLRPCSRCRCCRRQPLCCWSAPRVLLAPLPVGWVLLLLPPLVLALAAVREVVRARLGPGPTPPPCRLLPRLLQWRAEVVLALAGPTARALAPLLRALAGWPGELLPASPSSELVLEPLPALTAPLWLRQLPQQLRTAALLAAGCRGWLQLMPGHPWLRWALPPPQGSPPHLKVLGCPGPPPLTWPPHRQPRGVPSGPLLLLAALLLPLPAMVRLGAGHLGGAYCCPPRLCPATARCWAWIATCPSLPLLLLLVPLPLPLRPPPLPSLPLPLPLTLSLLLLLLLLLLLQRILLLDLRLLLLILNPSEAAQVPVQALQGALVPLRQHICRQAEREGTAPARVFSWANKGARMWIRPTWQYTGNLCSPPTASLSAVHG